VNSGKTVARSAIYQIRDIFGLPRSF